MSHGGCRPSCDRRSLADWHRDGRAGVEQCGQLGAQNRSPTFGRLELPASAYFPVRSRTSRDALLGSPARSRWDATMYNVIVMRFRNVALAPCLIASVLGAQRPDTLRADGLRQPVEILRDRLGISHIYAKNEHDL